ncbi:Uncharacterised protein [Exiguobacterium aurantiacum]|uniref:Uncharacterized protein n=1 Tax=Exiguobacterium aurantiacum TaxID=33987 RepID=A0A377HH29_9BACL|nr:Uncharacterised protein [Exiguobacterium aurantiacum]
MAESAREKRIQNECVSSEIIETRDDRQHATIEGMATSQVCLAGTCASTSSFRPTLNSRTCTPRIGRR